MHAAPSLSTLTDWYVRNRARSRALFDLLDPAVYYSRPIALRNPIVFYEGHLPAFGVIAFLKRGLGRPGLDDRLEALFARGIDPDSAEAAVPRSGADTRWPARADVLAYGDRVDAAMLQALEGIRVLPGGGLDRQVRDGAFTAVEHEAMHQETLLYMWRRLPYEAKRKPDGVRYEVGGDPPRQALIAIPEGPATLGARRDEIPFGWDNEFDALTVQVPGFDIDTHAVTNAEYLEFVGDEGYERAQLWTPAGWEWRTRDAVRHPAFWIRRDGAWFWRGMFEDIPLPAAWPVYVSGAEAAAYARWRGRRLPTEPEYHRAAFGTPRGAERALPWAASQPIALEASRGNIDFQSWEPVPAGARPAGASAWGVHDLVGNGWEWTSSIFGPFPGFRPMPSYPEYSAEFFDGAHYVLKGASPGTASALVRRSFRNWFRPNYPYIYAKFRTVSARPEGGRADEG